MATIKRRETSSKDVLTPENMERLGLEETRNNKNELTGYRIVQCDKDPRVKSRDLRFSTPKLHVSGGGETYMFGKLFNESEGDLKRWYTLKTSRDFKKNPEWIDNHPEALTDNEEYYDGVERLVERVKDLLWEKTSVRDQFMGDVITENHRNAFASELLNLKEERKKSEKLTLRSMPEILRKTATAAKIDMTKPSWRNEAILYVQQHGKSQLESKVFLDKLVNTMKSNEEYKKKALKNMIKNPTYAEDEELGALAREAFNSKFRTWVFYGGETADGEELTADDPPFGVHRAKMRPFVLPQGKNKPSPEFTTLDFKSATNVPVHENAIKTSGLNEEGAFKLERDMREKGITVRKIRYMGNFPKEVKMHKLPDGRSVPWYDDPRVYVLRPGSIVQLSISFFVYVKPDFGIRMQFDQIVRLFERGPAFSQPPPEMDMSEATVVEADDEEINDSSVEPLKILPSDTKRKRSEENEIADENADDDDDDDGGDEEEDVLEDEDDITQF